MKGLQSDKTTVIICCAGMGTRLGIGTTKALVDICGVPLIIRQLELLKEFDDIRILNYSIILNNTISIQLASISMLCKFNKSF